MNSFLYPQVPRVNVFRSLSCSPSIRQSIRRRSVTLYFNLHWNSQILEYRSQGDSNLTSFQHCVKLRLSNAQCFEALIQISHCGYRSEPPVPSCSSSRLGRQQSRCPRRLSSCQHVSVFDTSAALWAFPPDVALHVSMGQSQKFRCFSKIQSVLGQV